MSSEKPALPDGLVVIVKRECATCQMVEPLLADIAAVASLTAWTQDDPTFAASVGAVHDADLSISWHHEIETVPTLIKVENGKEVERTVGWSRDDWRRLTGVATLGDDLPATRPGCGSMSVDPDRLDALRARFSGSPVVSRTVEFAEAEDEFEAMFARGWTDGFPVVPPTRERVLRMLTGTTRAPNDVVTIVPPDLVELTVEKIAINAVMAGCLPEYLPWVIAALEAVCTDEFNMHGVLATTMPVGPVIVCNGPGTRAIGMNSGINVFGQGNRANSTIGRAVQLTVRNVGGGRPGEVDRATHGNPGKLSFCFAEDELASPFTPFSESRGMGAGVDSVTVFAGEGPRCVVDQLARTPEELAASYAACLRTVHHPKLVIGFDAILVVSPDHGRIFADAGWTRDRLLDELHSRLLSPGADLMRGAHGIAEGVPPHLGSAEALPKFRPGGLMIAYAGGGAGLFSSIIAGWANGAIGSDPVSRPVGT
ncbi:MAG: thioredoxin family protein [Ilumatobacteraceae bacterium]